jgi:hypothetical protein
MVSANSRHLDFLRQSVPRVWLACAIHPTACQPASCLGQYCYPMRRNDCCVTIYAATSGELVDQRGCKMRRVVFMIGIGIAGFAFNTSDVQAKTFSITESQVKHVCGDKLQSGNGAMGCTKCSAGNCRDYSCNDGSVGGKKGCFEIIVRGGPGGGKGRSGLTPSAPTGGRLDTGKGFGPQGPAPTGGKRRD